MTAHCLHCGHGLTYLGGADWRHDAGPPEDGHQACPVRINPSNWGCVE